MEQRVLPDQVVGLFRADAIWTTAHGRRLTSRDEISAFTHQVLQGCDEGVDCDLRGGARVVHPARCRRRQGAAAAGDARPLEGRPEGYPLYIMAKEDRQCRLVAGQNTLVLDA
jgi:uncharacterized protein (TIGR02246 family)